MQMCVYMLNCLILEEVRGHKQSHAAIGSVSPSGLSKMEQLQHKRLRDSQLKGTKLSSRLVHSFGKAHVVETAGKGLKFVTAPSQAKKNSTIKYSGLTHSYVCI